MTTFVVGTDSVHTSAQLCDYLDGRLREGDAVHAVNSLRGGDETGSIDVRDGEEALNAVVSRLSVRQGVTVESNQYVRGNAPPEDLFAAADESGADELVIGGSSRTATSKTVFGSVLRSVLSNADRPVVVVPPTE